MLSNASYSSGCMRFLLALPFVYLTDLLLLFIQREKHNTNQMCFKSKLPVSVRYIYIIIKGLFGYIFRILLLACDFENAEVQSAR